MMLTHNLLLKPIKSLSFSLTKSFTISTHIHHKHTIKATITESTINTFSRISGDTNPLHINKEFAEKSIFKQRISHGMLPMGFIEQYFSSLDMKIKSMEIKFVKPIYLEEEIVVDIKLIENETNEKNSNILSFEAEIRKKVEEKKEQKEQKQETEKSNNNNSEKEQEKEQEKIIKEKESQLFSSTVTIITGQVEREAVEF